MKGLIANTALFLAGLSLSTSAAVPVLNSGSGKVIGAFIGTLDLYDSQGYGAITDRGFAVSVYPSGNLTYLNEGGGIYYLDAQCRSDGYLGLTLRGWVARLSTQEQPVVMVRHDAAMIDLNKAGAVYAVFSQHPKPPACQEVDWISEQRLAVKVELNDPEVTGVPNAGYQPPVTFGLADVAQQCIFRDGFECK